jgi:hypothetical protein
MQSSPFVRNDEFNTLLIILFFTFEHNRESYLNHLQILFHYRCIMVNPTTPLVKRGLCSVPTPPPPSPQMSGQDAQREMGGGGERAAE